MLAFSHRTRLVLRHAQPAAVDREGRQAPTAEPAPSPAEEDELVLFALG